MNRTTNSQDQREQSEAYLWILCDEEFCSEVSFSMVPHLTRCACMQLLVHYTSKNRAGGSFGVSVAV